MLNPKVEMFLENNNMTYLFLQLANLEVKRLDGLPDHVRNKLPKKITELALEHVATNLIPEYQIEEEQQPDEDVDFNRDDEDMDDLDDD